ncbi:MAG TPA: hypothetical protein VKB27_12030 [Gammaproteobacteria bacterium]|nr:hypothetical protein [Gammaproteobacteria bacterium]
MEDDNFQQLINKISTNIEAFTYPLLRVDSKDLPDVYASCVFVEISGKFFFITAAHAIRDHHKGLLTRGDGQLVDIEGATTLSKFPGKDHFDIAAIHIADSFVKENKIEVVGRNKFVTSVKVTNPHSRVVAGYPASMNKQNKILDKANKRFTGKSFCYFAFAEFNGDYSLFQKSPNVHVGLEFKSGKDDKGRQITTPPWPPRGFSGGGSWLIPDLNHPENFFLEGIFIEGHKRAKRMFGFSTRLKHIEDFISQPHNKALQSDRPTAGR